MASLRPSARVPVVDGLRGIALLGILTENLLSQFRVSPYDAFLPPAERLAPPSTGLDGLVASFVAAVVESKAMTLFALLFGLGIAAQRERFGHFGARMTRRLAFLLVLGLAHMFLVWSGDILALYAVAGIFAVLLSGLPPRALLLTALLCLVSYELPIPYPPPFTSLEAMLKYAREAQHMAASGDFVANVLFRLEHPRPFVAPLVRALPRTVGLFLLGIGAWRSGLVRDARSVRAIHAVVLVGVGAMLAWAARSKGSETIANLAALVLAAGYAASFVAAHGHERVASVIAWFAPVGRMTLSCYIAQSVVFGAVFGAWGLGLFGRWGEAHAASVGVLVFAAQALFASWWLRRHHLGPLEWLWRSFTVGAWQPMRRDGHAR